VPPEELATIAAEVAGELAAGESAGGDARLPQVHVAPDATSAWRAATALAGRKHLICITGSFFIAAELRSALRESGAI
jgi:hypothetical protein